jgi:2-polyprenyl-3-methyl-5-hydroxy-6-metoxy-1,4-benzoquinol methylase
MPEDHMDEVYESPNPLVRWIHRGRLEAITREVPQTGQLKILDAGCGEGHLLEKLHSRLPHHLYTGVDITDIALRKAEERCSFAEIKKFNLSETGFNNEHFDIVICTEVIEHVYEVAEVLSELKRVLKTGGFLIITFPNEILWTICRFLLGRRPVKVPDHVNSFTPRKMKSLMRLKLHRQKNLPFGLPFSFSLNSVLKFQKKES